MQVLSPRVDWTGFLEAIPTAASRVLMLDYDGTLAPFQPRPERALPYPGVREALASLIEAAGTRIVIISGRGRRRSLSLVDDTEMTSFPERSITFIFPSFEKPKP